VLVGEAGAAEEVPAVGVALAAADWAAFLAGELEVATAAAIVATTSTAVIARTVRCPPKLPGKFTWRSPSTTDTITAQLASRPPAT
jgi:hypothetical protein